MASPRVRVWVAAYVCLTIIQKFYKQNERPLHGKRAGRVRARARDTETETTCKQFSSAILGFFLPLLSSYPRVSMRVCLPAGAAVWVEHFPVPLTAGSVWISEAWPQEMPLPPPHHQRHSHFHFHRHRQLQQFPQQQGMTTKVWCTGKNYITRLGRLTKRQENS